MSRRKGGAPKPPKAKLIYNEKEINEGSSLYVLMSRLAALGERETAGAAMVVDALLAAGATGKRLVQMQAQLDRIEGRIVELMKGRPSRAQEAQASALPPSSASAPVMATAPEPAPEPHKKPASKPSRKRSRTVKTDVSKELAELEESVEQRQARMAKMEKDDKRKALALKKKQEELKSKNEKQTKQTAGKKKPVAETEAKAADKKKPRKRKKPAKTTDATQAS